MFNKYCLLCSCDGSTAITSHVITQCDIGRTRAACKFTIDNVFPFVICIRQFSIHAFLFYQVTLFICNTF